MSCSASTSSSMDLNKGFSPTPMQQIVSASSGALLTSLFVTPLDVVKVRLQKQVRHQRARPFSRHYCSLMTPLEVVKTRLQAQTRPLMSNQCFLYSNGLMDHLCTCTDAGIENCRPWYARPARPTPFTGTLDAFVKIARYEGVPSLWSGLSPTLVMAIPATVCYFTLYDNLHLWLSRRSGRRFWTAIVAGMSARGVVVTLISPIEMVRTKIQSEKITYFEMATAIRSTLVRSGWRVFWRGWGPTLLRDVPFSGIYWGCYENMKKVLMAWNGVRRTNFGISFVSGAVAGSLASLCSHPFDVIKTHRQIEIGEQISHNGTPKKSTSTFALLGRLYRQQGLRSLFTGAVPRVIKVAPACAIMIGTYEYGKIFFQDKNRLRM